MQSKLVFQNHPYTEKPRTEVMHITKDLVAPFIYPTPQIGMDCSDISYIYVSTEEFTASWYTVAPGSRFEPADYHAGDEVYIVLEGTLTMLNTSTGQVVNVREGEGLLMPMGTPHIGYNFGKIKTKTAAFLAPKIFADQSFPTDTIGKIRLYKKDELIKPYDASLLPVRAGLLDDLGSWPVDGEKARESNMFYHIPENKKLLAIGGIDNPVLLKFIVSNDFLNVAEMIIPSGGKGARMTDPDSHEGDCVIYVNKGCLSVLIHDTGETFQIQDDEAIFIPKHAYIVSAFCASIGGILLASRLGSAQMNAADGYLMPSVAATFISLSVAGAGKANPIGAMLGALLMGMMENGLIMESVPYYSMNIFKGLVLAVALALAFVGDRDKE